MHSMSAPLVPFVSPKLLAELIKGVDTPKQKHSQPHEFFKLHKIFW